MIEKLLYLFIGISIASTGIAIYAINRLFKKQSTTNNIEDQKIKNKRNKGSNIDNNIKSSIEQKDKRPRRRKMFNKKD